MDKAEMVRRARVTPYSRNYGGKCRGLAGRSFIRQVPSSTPEAVTTPEGCWTNFLGLHTRADLFPNAEHVRGRYISDLPLTGDGVYGPAAEYAALLSAIDAKGSDRTSFCAIELGAGWGPWISAAGIVCKRLGFNKIDLVGVEADKMKVARMVEHLSANGLMQEPARSKILHGAAWYADTTVFFPQGLAVADYGGAATSGKSDTDYRGFNVAAEATPAYSLATICADIDRIDFAHWDVQGAEWDIADKSRDLIDKRMHHVVIGTHSRKIEGNLLDLFFGLGWDLLRHEPCRYQYDRSKPSLEAMTLNDGHMFFRNPRF